MANAMRTIYHVKDGPVMVYHIDANSAVAHHPKEWSNKPWGDQPQEVIAIPDKWEDLKPSERINLAVTLGEKRKGLTAAAADEAIAREIERRATETE